MEMTTIYFASVLILATIFGFAAQRSQLCPVGGLREGLNGQGWHRISTYFIVIGVALLATSLIEFMEWVQLDDTKPPYRSSQLAWGRYVIGGFVFGFGMVLASGCGMRNLVRLGQGSAKALIILIVMSITAYIMTRTSVYAEYFMPWLTPMTLDLSSIGNQKLSDVLFATDSNLVQLITSLTIATIIIFVSLRSIKVKQPIYWASALMIGLVVSAGYLLTGGSFGASLIEQSEFMDAPLAGLGSQSFTFAAPMGDLVYWMVEGGEKHLVTFGVLAIFGMIIGSLIAALIFKQFSFAWFASLKDATLSLIGAIMVGIGAVTAMGCSIGHGVTGIATLAAGSFIALFAIGLGAWTGLWVERKWINS